MADETPSDTPASDTPPQDTTPKKETVRITLPSKPSETPVVKRETVRFNPAPPAGDVAPESTDSVKGQTIRIAPISAVPKKETTRVITPPPASVPSGPLSGTPGIQPPPSSFPAVPAFSPKPLTPGGLPGIKPLTPPGPPGAGGPPKPPGPGIKTGPLGTPPKPAGPPGAPPAPMAGAIPVKPAPKKETARIQVAPQKPMLPKATVKMQQTQPMMPMAAPVISKPVVASEIEEAHEPAGDDGLTIGLSLVACLVAIGAAVVYWLAYSSVIAPL